MIVVLDNAHDHHAVLLRPFLCQHAKHLRLLFLPPYSTRHASIERVWKLARRLATHYRYVPPLEDVVKAVRVKIGVARFMQRTECYEGSRLPL